MPVPKPSSASGVNHHLDTPTVYDWEAVGRVLIDMIANGRRPDVGGVPLDTGDIQVLEDYINREARPHRTNAEPKAIEFPVHRLVTFRIEQSSWTEFVLRLPVDIIGACGRDRVCPPDPTLDYNEPPFYKEKIVDGSIDNCQFFHCRVADYTMSMCK